MTPLCLIGTCEWIPPTHAMRTPFLNTCISFPSLTGDNFPLLFCSLRVSTDLLEGSLLQHLILDTLQVLNTSFRSVLVPLLHIPHLRVAPLRDSTMAWITHPRCFSIVASDLCLVSTNPAVDPQTAESTDVARFALPCFPEPLFSRAATPAVSRPLHRTHRLVSGHCPFAGWPPGWRRQCLGVPCTFICTCLEPRAQVPVPCTVGARRV